MTQRPYVITNHIEAAVARGTDQLTVTVHDLNYIPPGKSYPSIKYLRYTPRTSIKDLSALQAFPHVKTLLLELNQKEDEAYCLDGIAGMSELETLRIFRSCPDNLAGIEFCSMLSELHIDTHPALGNELSRNDGSKILDLAVLNGHPSLTMVLLKCPADIDSLDWSTLPSLQILNLTRCLPPHNNNFEFLRNASLETLSCYACGLDSIEGLQTAKLAYLTLEHNRFAKEPSIDLPTDCLFNFTQYGI